MRKFITWFIFSGLACLWMMGCATVQEGKESRPYTLKKDSAKYAVNTLVVHVPGYLLPEWRGDVALLLPERLKEKGVEVQQLPAFFLDAGESREINGMATYTFPSRFNTDGTPAKTTSLKIGSLYRVSLLTITNGLAELDIQYDRSTINEWNSFGSEDVAPFRTYPVCEKETLTAQIAVKPNTWRIAGSCNTQEDDRHVLVLVYVCAPKNVSESIPRTD